jgi:lipopolysaccharide/colanic/teichoic acid biosynthesis glycosyltransferase
MRLNVQAKQTGGFRRSSGSVDRKLYRTAEIAIAATGLMLAAPLVVIIAVAIVIESGCPILFRQQRVGLRGQPFTLLKFRSMRVNAGGVQITRSGDQRITRVGGLLRRYKLDELPQLWNVVRGDMSFVGPRPEVERFVDLRDARWQHVLSVPPGITDVATLMYRDEEALLAGVEDVERYYRASILPTKLALNLEYLSIRTWWTDLRVIALTIWSSAFPGRVNLQEVRHTFFKKAVSGESH